MDNDNEDKLTKSQMDSNCGIVRVENGWLIFNVCAITEIDLWFV